MMVEIIGFDSNRLSKWSKMSAMTRQRWINFSEKEGNMEGIIGFEKFLLTRQRWINF